MATKQSALIIGASRGLGLAMVEEWLGKDWAVVATVRTVSSELALLAARFPDSLEIEIVEITDAASVDGLRRRLDARTFDVLFVNAGICLANEESPSSADERDFTAMMLTNAFAPMRFIERFENVVATDGVIAVMSSELGSIAGNGGFWELYSASKAALNMLMKCYAAQRPNTSHALLLVAPGWVRTDMGGPTALLSIEESIPQVVKMVTSYRGKPGLRFVDRKGSTLPW
jgi:NAD(P)-dependent dehydrogenase (short-subunit alcohol dehydrogenase family)